MPQCSRYCRCSATQRAGIASGRQRGDELEKAVIIINHCKSHDSRCRCYYCCCHLGRQRGEVGDGVAREEGRRDSGKEAQEELARQRA